MYSDPKIQISRQRKTEVEIDKDISASDIAYMSISRNSSINALANVNEY